MTFTPKGNQNPQPPQPKPAGTHPDGDWGPPDFGQGKGK